MVEKKKKLTITKMFRLFDCNFYDYKPEQNTNSSDEEQHINQDTPNFMVELYGINESGETACIKVNNYKPFFYIKVGDDWTSNNIGQFKSWFSKKIWKTRCLVNFRKPTRRKIEKKLCLKLCFFF